MEMEICHLQPLHSYYIMVIQWCRDRPQQTARHSLPRMNTSTAQRSGDSQVHTTLYLFVNEHSIMLPMKNGAIKQLQYKETRSCGASGHLALQREEKAVCMSEAWTGEERGTGGRSQTDSDTKLLYCWMFRLRISEHGPRTRSNRGRSNLTHFKGPRATTVAARGRFISRAISPGKETVRTITYGSYFLKESTSEQVNKTATFLLTQERPHNICTLKNITG